MINLSQKSWKYMQITAIFQGTKFRAEFCFGKKTAETEINTKSEQM
jgi:hypothetical protein